MTTVLLLPDRRCTGLKATRDVTANSGCLTTLVELHLTSVGATDGQTPSVLHAELQHSAAEYADSLKPGSPASAEAAIRRQRSLWKVRAFGTFRLHCLYSSGACFAMRAHTSAAQLSWARPSQRGFSGTHSVIAASRVVRSSVTRLSLRGRLMTACSVWPQHITGTRSMQAAL